MKLKVQKSYFKKLVLLLLLLSGGLNFSFSTANAAVTSEGQELLITAEFQDQLQDMREGSLPTIISLNLYGTNYASGFSTYQYLSSEEAKQSTTYIHFSRSIDPALAASEIIYPFHFFL